MATGGFRPQVWSDSVGGPEAQRNRPGRSQREHNRRDLEVTEKSGLPQRRQFTDARRFRDIRITQLPDIGVAVGPEASGPRGSNGFGPADHGRRHRIAPGPSGFRRKGQHAKAKASAKSSLPPPGW